MSDRKNALHRPRQAAETDSAAVTRRTALIGGATLGLTFAPSIRGVASAAGECSPPLDSLLCYLAPCPLGPGTELCVLGKVPGGEPNVDVHFVWVAESFEGPGVSCPIHNLVTNVVLNQPSCFENPLCDPIPLAILNEVSNNCPVPQPGRGPFRLATWIDFKIPGTTTTVHTCSAGKVDCNCNSASCP